MSGVFNMSLSSVRVTCVALLLLAACIEVQAEPLHAGADATAAPVATEPAPIAEAGDAAASAATERAMLAERARSEGLYNDPQTAALLREATDTVLAQAERDRLLQQATVSEADVARRFAERPGDFDEFRLSHVFVAERPEAGSHRHPLTQAQTLERAQMLRTRVQAGEDFGRLATEQSDDGATAVEGGQLSSMFGLYLATPFAVQVRSLSVGEVSAPVRGPGGYHLIRLDEKHTATLDHVGGMIEAQLREERRDRAIAQMLQETLAASGGISAVLPSQRPAVASEQQRKQ